VSFGPGLAGARLAIATDIIGSVDDSNLDSWTLEIARFGSMDFRPIATGTTTVQNAILGRIDPTALANGIYELRLRASDLSGRVSQSTILLDVNSTSKPGQYQRVETDLHLDLAGASLDLQRAYDGLQADRSGTFGFGWHLANRDFDIQVEAPRTGRDDRGEFAPFRAGTRLYLTLPDGRRVGYTFTPEKHETPGIVFYTPVFSADAGVDFTLLPAQTLLTRSDDGSFFDLRTARPYNPASGLFQGPE